VLGLPKVYVVCLFDGYCYWKSLRRIPLHKEISIPICRFEHECSQKLSVSPQKLASLNYDLKELRKKHFKLQLKE
jgi:hypothetical protein